MPEDDNLLDIQVGVWDGAAPDAESAWLEAVKMSISDVFGEEGRFPVRAIILLATADWCRTDRPLSAMVLDQIKNRITEGTPLIGGSSPRIFVSLPGTTVRQHCIECGFCVILLRSPELWVSAGAIPSPHARPSSDVDSDLRTLVKNLKGYSGKHPRLGTSAAADLFGFFPGPVVDEQQLRTLPDLDLHKRVLDAFHHEYSLFGASTADDIWPNSGFQFLNRECLQSGLVLALVQYDFSLGGAMAHGFHRVPGIHLSVDGLVDPIDETSYTVALLDDEPAGPRLSRLLAEVSFGVNRPILGMGSHEEPLILIPTVRPSDLSESVTFSRRVPFKWRLSVLAATPEELRHTAAQTLRLAITRSRSRLNRLRLILGFSCVGRYEYFNREHPDNWWTSLRALANDFEDLPFVCALCSGEFGEDQWRRPRGDHFSLWFACLSGQPNHRSRNRRLQLSLLNAATDLLRYNRPEAVMDAAITGARSAGAAGAQISICDSALGKILGKGHGIGRGHGFENILELTVRDLPESGARYDLPETFLRWTRIVGLPQHLTKLLRPDDGTDILSILAANQLAVFVPDTSDPLFYCDPECVKLVGPKSQFIAPLLGAQGALLAMLQIAFPIGTEMDSEAFALWLGYAQKLATALERAFEIEEREAKEAITLHRTQIMKSHPAARLPRADIEEFLDTVQKTLGADYIHLRARQQDIASKSYELLAAKGPLADIHYQVRPMLQANEGSIGHAKGSDETFTNTISKTRQVYSDINATITTSSALERLWAIESERICSAGLLALKDGQDVFGVLVIDSTSEYYFTERQKRLARLAAQEATALLLERRSTFQKRQDENRSRRLLAVTMKEPSHAHRYKDRLALIQRCLDIVQGESMTATIRSAVDDISKYVSEGRHELESREALTSPALQYETPQSLISAAMEGLKFGLPISLVINPSANELFVPTATGLVDGLRYLIENAIESRHSTVEIRVDLKHEGDRAVLAIHIENDGDPVTEAEIERFFVPGFSTKLRKTEEPHLGQGVPLAWAGVYSVGGTLSIVPREGGGVVALIEIGGALSRKAMASEL